MLCCFVADTILEAGGQEKVFTPLLGKGVKLWVRGKLVDSLFAEIDKDVRRIKDTKDRFDELKKLTEQCDWSDENAFSKEDRESIKSALEEVKNMEKSQLQSYAKDLAKKIKEYSDSNKNV